MPLKLVEDSPKWLRMLEVFHENGASKPEGWQVSMPELVALFEMPTRTAGTYLKKMEDHQIIQVVRTTVAGGWGNPRTFNRYKLLCTPERWTRSVGPAIIAQRRRDMNRYRVAINRNTAHELKLKRARARLAALEEESGVQPGAAKPKVAKPTKVEATPPAPVEREELAVLIAEQADVADEELVGW